MCTELSCACSVRPVFGTCRSAVSRYYFDQSTGLCLNFSGGCGAQNMNEYATPRECYEDCNRNSEFIEVIQQVSRASELTLYSHDSLEL